MKNLEEFLAAYVKKYGSVKVVVDGDASWSFTSHSHEGGPGTTPTPEQAETMQVEEPNTVEELPEGFPFSVTGTETSEEDDEPKSEEDKVW